MDQHSSNIFAYQQHRQQQQQQLPTEQAMQSHDMAHIYHFGDDENSLLDPAILESGLVSHPQTRHYRRDSFAHTHSIMSPAESQHWEPSYPPTLQPIDRPASSAQSHFRETRGTQGSQPSTSRPLQAHPAWSLHQQSLSSASQQVDLLSPQISTDNSLFAHAKGEEHGHTARDHSQNPSLSTEQPYFTAPQAQTPIPPHNPQEWMALAQQEMESRPLSKRMRPGTPPRSLLDLRRDGAIHKKNKRIDIPQERNIQTIDQMIEKTQDEELLKELKAQKRLLRNREAALASRQRKKKHTEDLEKSEKGYMSQINSLEKEVENLAMERNNLHQDREILIHRHQDAERVIEAMHMEKRDLIMKHTEDTASLRKKVQVLMEQLEAITATTMSAAPSSTGYTDFNAEMEALSMEPHDWDSFMLSSDLSSSSLHDLGFNTPHGESRKLSMPPEALTPVAEPSAAATTTTTTTTHSDSSTDKPVASGLLFMLLLCGAFVVSNPSVTNTGNLPPLPPDVQAAAPTVLSNLLADSSVAGVAPGDFVSSHIKQEPLLPHQARPNARMPDRMARLHRSLTTPSRQQEIDSAFALTQSQYAALTNPDALHNEDTNNEIPIMPRRTLAHALSSSLPPPTENKAAVYTRSLLWDQIPADVVQQFKRMVQSRAESGECSNDLNTA